MARRSPYLLLRGNIWWLRVRVPDQLRPVLGKGEIRRSLKTSDASEAKRLVRIERISVEADFDDARRALAQNSTSPGVKSSLPELTTEQIWALTARWFIQKEKQHAGVPPLEVDYEYIENQAHQLAFIESFEDASTSVIREIDKILSEAGVSVDPSGVPTPWMLNLRRTLHAAMIEFERRKLNRLTGRQEMALDPAFHGFSASTPVQPVAILPVTFSELIRRYESDPGRPRPSRKAKMKFEAQRRLFEEVIGEKTLLGAVNREKARKLLDILKVLPANITKRHKGKSALSVAKLAEEKQLQPMSVTTANSYMSAFVSMLDFAEAEGLIEKNPAKGLRLASDGVRRKDKRLPFTVADLNAIFAAPLYSGCLDDRLGYARPGPNRPRRGRFWVPIVSLFSGMRMNEICQLSEDDITVDDGTDIILVRSDEDGTKRVKTSSGHRFIPVHPELKRLGFLDHVAKVRADGGSKARLFPELSTASTGYISDNFSKWFANFLDKVAVTDGRKNFHSFRHTFRDALREAEIPQDRVRELGGWSSGSTEDDYGAGTRPSTLAREIAKVRYEGLDLGHLAKPIGT
jgi:integrase